MQRPPAAARAPSCHPAVALHVQDSTAFRWRLPVGHKALAVAATAHMHNWAGMPCALSALQHMQPEYGIWVLIDERFCWSNTVSHVSTV
jgi:hypothetical protein